MLHRVIRLYLTNAGTLLDTLAHGWAAGELDTIRLAAHTLKSSSHQLGTYGLAALCSEVENDARQQRHDGSGDALRRIQQVFTQARAALETYLS
ncbi:MAG: Hpt domain-containing protein [Methylobacter sp.]|nr:Hpt domain-containing protein [Methylobacter sp.]